MSETYLEQKIREVLEEAEGNPTGAVALLKKAAEDDELVYNGITSPFLDVCTTFAVQQYMKVHAPRNKRHAEGLTDGDIQTLVQKMATNTDANDFLTTKPVGRRRKPASDAHKDSVTTIADAFKK